MAEILREYEEHEDAPKETLEDTQALQFYKDMCLGLKDHFVPIGFIESWADSISDINITEEMKSGIKIIISLMLQSWQAISSGKDDDEEPEGDKH